ncbi:MAG: hypothetical protein U0234_02425 [Sandaracinus sp.]
MRTVRLVALVLALGTGAASALAQPPTVASTPAPHPLSEYGGVTPGTAHPPPRARALRARRPARGRATQIIAWPGFQMQPSGGSRFFVETTGPVTTEIHASSGRVEIVFHDTGVHLANSRRWLETQYFETPVVRARLERRRRDMVLVMQLRAPATPVISTGADGSGFTFTYIDFAPGHYLPETPVAPPPPPVARDSGGGTASVRPAAPASEAQYPTSAMDDERPPPVQTGH